MRKVLSLCLVFCFAILPVSNQVAAAYTVTCTNCSDRFTQALERATSLEQLQLLYSEYAESVMQTEQQIRILLTEIDLYNNMVQNTIKLPAQIVNVMTGDFGKLARLTRDIQITANEVAAMGNLFERIYRNDEFLEGIATAGRSSRLEANMRYREQQERWEDEVNRSQEAIYRLSGQELDALINDASAFEKHMQELLSTPQGQMQALEAANELAAININEARHLRTLMTTTAQANALHTMKLEKEAEFMAREWNTSTRTDMLDGVSGKNAKADPF